MNNKKNTKDGILKASIHLMHLKGYNGTSVKDITVAAGIPKGSFYTYFEDKEHYAVDALNYYYSVVLKDLITKLNNKDEKALDRIKGFYLCSIKLLEVNNLKLGCFIGIFNPRNGEVSCIISKVNK